jgi:hypothetical protein
MTTQTAMASIHDMATLQGVMLHVATLPVFWSSPHVTGAAGTEDTPAHHTMIMPYELVGTALSQAPVVSGQTILDTLSLVSSILLSCILP